MIIIQRNLIRYVTSSTVNQGYVDVIGNMSGTSYYDLTGGGVGNYNMNSMLQSIMMLHIFNGGTVHRYLLLCWREDQL